MTNAFPRIVPMGLTGLLVQFSDRLADAPNRAALAFAQRLEAASLAGVEEIAPSLGGTFLRLDPQAADRDAVMARIGALLAEGGGHAAAGAGRRWTVPVAFDGPDLAAAADAAGCSVAAATEELAATALRVMAIGFAPGLPYMGILPARWDIPRKAGLTPRVPAGGVVVAVRQAILFPAETPTGWWHVGQSAFRGFRPAAREPFLLRPGDEVRLRPVTAETLDAIRRDDPEGGGATVAAQAEAGE